MTLVITSVDVPDEVVGTLFLSASIPDPGRWDGKYDAFEITDAVVAFGRVFLTAGWRLVTAAHPTIAPLMLYLAAEIPAHQQYQVTTYQSRLFSDVLPEATRRFEASGIGKFEWTEAAEGDRPEPGRWDSSLEVMRRKMLLDTQPNAALFIGGMQGIFDEYRLVSELLPLAKRYAVGYPGGAAAGLFADVESSPVASELRDGTVYPTIARNVLADLSNP